MLRKLTGQPTKIAGIPINSKNETLYRLLVAAEYRDDDTGKHILRVGKYSYIIARKLKLSRRFLEFIESAAQMHDIGKVGIPDSILLKECKLSLEEFEIMKTHTTIGARILENSRNYLVNIAYDIALTHHERWDGAGYPFGRKKEEIPLAGRIVALADVFDALTSKRHYKKAFTWEKSLSIINAGKGRHFDPYVVEAFLKGRDKARDTYDQYVTNKD
ncbi:MAG: HD domain-containing phosphohydrolase [Candidatus Omnitrophota bacterium]|jgi:putative two-component system response regulator